MPKFLLPSFRGVGGEPAPQGTRTWESFPMAELGRFASALAAPKDLPIDLFVDAIPDVWAKALLFAYALSDEGHTLHTRAVGSFRGFLAMLALRSVHKYPVSVVEVDLDPESPLPFEAAVARLLPAGNDASPNGTATHALSSAAAWNPCYVFLMGDEPVGICSPLTFIAPHEGPDMKTAGDRGLTDGFRFTDPTNNFGPLEAGMLHQWLHQLQSHLVTNAPDGLWRKTVTTQILSFQNELKQRAAPELPGIKFDVGDLTAIATPFYQPLGKALARPAGDLVRSNFELRQRPGSKDHVLVVDEAIVQHLAPGAEVITGITAAMLKDQVLGTDREHLGHYELPSGWIWLRPSDFLLPRLTVVQSKDAFISVAEIRIQQGKASDPTPVPPLRETVTAYLEADYVSQHCWFERGNAGFTFRLQLPVLGQQAVEARQSYSFTDLRQIDLLYMPVIEIWPATRLDNWKCYYTFWTRDSDKTRFYITPTGLAVFKNRKALDKNTREEVSLTEAPPGFLACYELVDGHSGIDKEPVGLLMPAFASTSARATTQTVTIGFDFGTTNTNIFLKTEKDPTPRPLTISPLTVQIVNNEKLAREGLMYRRFLPAQQDEAPFLSLLRRRANLSGGFEPIRDAHVLFYHQQVERDQFNDSDIVAYLKWTTATFNDDRVAFLQQLVLHAAYEARLRGADKLRFNYSYPTSFDDNTNELLQSFWRSVPAKMTARVGVPCELGESQTESVATAVYFARSLDKGDTALLGTGAMVLDIGGGTTDMSVWRNRDLQIQTSIRLSGREILLTPMEENKSYVIKMLAACMPGGEEIFAPLQELTGDRFYRRADAILRAHGDLLVDRLNSLMQDDNFERFRSEIALRLTALIYYAGLLLRRKNWLASNPRLPDLYVGGNGCRILNWLAPPEFHENHAVMDLLLSAYAAGAGSDRPPSDDLRIILSDHPKSEVACGLVFEDFPQASKQAVEDVAGERFAVAGQDFPETEPLSASLLQRGVHIAQAQEIGRVLSVYNDFTNRRGAIFFPVSNTQQIVQRATEMINDWAGRRKSEDVRSMAVEPMFVVGVVESFSLAEWKVQAANAAFA